MPPLRERLEDVPILVQALVPPLSKELGRSTPKVSGRAMKKLAGYPWPGNVRELRNVLERTLLTLAGDEIRSEDLVLEANTSAAAMASASGGGLPGEEWEIRVLDDV